MASFLLHLYRVTLSSIRFGFSVIFYPCGSTASGIFLLPLDKLARSFWYHWYTKWSCFSFHEKFILIWYIHLNKIWICLSVFLQPLYFQGILTAKYPILKVCPRFCPYEPKQGQMFYCPTAICRSLADFLFLKRCFHLFIPALRDYIHLGRETPRKIL